MKPVQIDISCKPKNKKSSGLCLFASAAAFVITILFCTAAVNARTYTTCADFNEGTLVGVEHDTVHNQLQLSKKAVTLPFIWVPNQNGTVSKVSTETGDELGRYRVAPHSDCSPSRTTVDLQGSCWVGNRQAGTVVKIGLYEAGMWIDRNNDGICQTSQDLDHDGNINGSEMLPWGEDECVLYEVVLIAGMEGTYAPGTYPGPYDYDYWGTAPRGLAVDASNNLWAGTWSSSKYYYIDDSTGAILNTVDVSPWGHNAYGAVIDRNGVLWSSGPSHTGSQVDNILSLDPSADPPIINKLVMGHRVYGLGLDYLDHLFVGGWDSQRLDRINIITKTLDWSQYKSESYPRGVVCTSDNNVWVVNSPFNTVTRYKNDGTLLSTIPVGSHPTGVAVDAAGKVWVCNLNDEYIERIDTNTNTVDLWKQIIGSGGHYTYSDMTGIISRTITTKIGTWTVIYDSGAQDTPWGIVSWTSDEPNETSVTVKVRSSNDQVNWSDWENATNGVLLSETPDGQYIEIQATLQIISGDVSPILYDLTIQGAMIPVMVDIKPTSCPNPLNVKSKGVLPVAILGSESLDVATIDIASIRLAGVAPIRSEYEDLATPVSDSNECECTTAGPDGYTDLSLKFITQEIVSALGDVNDGNLLTLKLTGVSISGIPIGGLDCVYIIQKGQIVPQGLVRADLNGDGKVNQIDFALLAQYWLESYELD